MLDLIILSFAAWRIAHILLYEEGPGNIFVNFRWRFGIYEEVDKDGFRKQVADPEKANFFTDLISCLYCASVWVGILIAIFYFLFPQITIYIAFPFALSTGILLIDNLMDGG